jgi:hypothetical protein
MQMLKSLALGVGLLAVPALALGQITYDAQFSGHADNGSGSGGSYVAGSSYVAYMTLNETQDVTWYPWDDTQEYTVVLSTTVTSFNVFGNLEVIDFGPATVNIYEDDTTPADYGNLGTFTDGTLLLSGAAQNMIGERVQVFGLPFGVTGVVVLNAGAGLGNVVACALDGLSMNDFIDFEFSVNPPGFEEAYDADWKRECEIAVESESWGGVKGLYR